MRFKNFRNTGLQDNKLGLTASLLAGRVAKCLLPPRPPLKGWVVKVLNYPQAAGQPAENRDLTSPYCSQRHIPTTGLHAMPALIVRNYRGKDLVQSKFNLLIWLHPKMFFYSSNRYEFIFYTHFSKVQLYCKL